MIPTPRAGRSYGIEIKIEQKMVKYNTYLPSISIIYYPYKEIRFPGVGNTI